MKQVLSIVFILFFASKNAFGQIKPEQLMGYWKQLQDSSITLNIGKKSWVFIQTDLVGQEKTVSYKVKYKQLAVKQGESTNQILVVRLRNKSERVEIQIDEFKENEALYYTNIRTKQQFGYLWEYRFVEIKCNS